MWLLLLGMVVVWWWWQYIGLPITKLREREKGRIIRSTTTNTYSGLVSNGGSSGNCSNIY